MAVLYVNGPRLKNLFIAGSKWVIYNEQELNDINVFPVPDGDTGTNMSATLRSVTNYIENAINVNDLSEVINGIANAALLGARGNSGVILSQIFRGMAIGIGVQSKLDSRALVYVLNQGYKQAYKSIANPVEGTIITVLKDCVEAAINAMDNNQDIDSLIDILLKSAKASLKQTPNYLPILKQTGVVDSGGQGFVYFLEGIHNFIHGQNLPEINHSISEEVSSLKEIPNSYRKYGYCSELLIHTENDINIEEFKSELSNFGDSLVLAEASSFLKVHLHTKNPGLFIEACLLRGVVSDIKIENIDEMHSNMEQNSKKTQIIAMAPGEGVKKIFQSLGCKFVIESGCEKNKTVDDINTVIHTIKARNIVILPNNPSMIDIAEKVRYLNKESSKNIFVVPTKSVPEGFAAMLAYTHETKIEDVIYDMLFSINGVKTGEVTNALQDISDDSVDIKKGDIISIYNKKSYPALTCKESLFYLLNEMIDESNDTIITMYYGNNIDVEEVNEIVDEVENRYNEMDIELHYGGQPHYQFIVSVE